jgi:hypothetical protein
MELHIIMCVYLPRRTRRNFNAQDSNLGAVHERCGDHAWFHGSNGIGTLDKADETQSEKQKRHTASSTFHPLY